MCIVAEPKPYLSSAWSEVAKVPLPAAIISTTSEQEVVLSGEMNADWSLSSMSHEENGVLPSASAGLVKIIGVWYSTKSTCLID